MTTYNELKREIERQSARLAFTTDPQNAQILACSIKDLIAALKAYPHGLIWCADSSGTEAS